MATATCHPEREHCARGLCRPCYALKWRAARLAGTPLVPKPKLVVDPEVQRQRNLGYWRRYRETHPEEMRAYRVRYKQADPERTHDQNLRAKFGIGLVQFRAMELAQSGVCLLCGAANRGRRLDVDHDHTTGVVRGLLCNNCNRALGHFKEDPELMRRAALYIERARARSA